MVNVAQLVRASDCGSEGRGFETHLSPPRGNLNRFPLFLFPLEYKTESHCTLVVLGGMLTFRQGFGYFHYPGTLYPV